MVDNALPAGLESPTLRSLKRSPMSVHPIPSGSPSAPTVVLVINSGSSSLKFSLIDSASEEVRVRGLAEALGGNEAVLHISRPHHAAEKIAIPRADHAFAIAAAMERINKSSIGVVGHRVVHGGEAFSRSARIDENVIDTIRECIPLAPLHNPAGLVGIEAARSFFPSLPHVAVFDTAFHQTMPEQAYLYAIPYEYYERLKIRRYGFHGTSHRYVAGEAARLLGKDLADTQLITAHLGNGCSACAVKGGLSVDTTMGFTPLEGLVMGTRCGDIDSNIIGFLSKSLGKPLAEITAILNRESGLLGLSGLSNDMRTLVAAAGEGHVRARIAIEVFCYRLAKGLLGLAAGLDRVDAIVFTGGIGEHSAVVREKTLSHLKILGPALVADHNENHGRDSRGRITAADSRLVVLVVPTHEELVIAREAARFLHPEPP
jgi:acetate kinase